MSQSIEMKLLQQVLEEVRELREEQRKTMGVKVLPTFLSMKDASKELSVSERTLRRMVSNGEILPSKIKNKPKIAASEIRRFSAAPKSAAYSPGSGRPVAKRPFPKGYSPDTERRRLTELRKKR